jgi:hypothetical protein
MILGYIDADDRLYDLNFAGLRMRLRFETETNRSFVSFTRIRDEGGVRYRILGEASITATVAMDHDGHAIPLLRPVEARLVRHEGGLLIVANPRVRDSTEPGYFLVKVRAMPSAVEFFFEDQKGTEIVSIPNDEVLRVEPGSEEAKVYVSAANVALPKEKIAYLITVRPAKTASSLLDGLPMSRTA